MNNISKLAWPFVVIVVVVLFHKQIGSQFDRLTGVSISGTEFSVVLQDTAKSKNDEAAYGIIKGLSREGIVALLGTAKSTQVLTYEYDNAVRLTDDFSGFAELQRNGLLEANAKLEDFENMNPNDLQYALSAAGIADIEVRLNTKGQYAWDIIAESVNRSINP